MRSGFYVISELIRFLFILECFLNYSELYGWRIKLVTDGAQYSLIIVRALLGNILPSSRTIPLVTLIYISVPKSGIYKDIATSVQSKFKSKNNM